MQLRNGGAPSGGESSNCSDQAPPSTCPEAVGDSEDSLGESIKNRPPQDLPCTPTPVILIQETWGKACGSLLLITKARHSGS